MNARVTALVLAMASLVAIAGERPAGSQSPQDSGDSVVLVTLDGARTEEVFGGLDVDVLKSTLKEGEKLEEQPAYRRFWAGSAEERRRKLMPFFWSLVTGEGSIAGDRALGSSVRLSNRHHFSYPGYAEILLGEPHDADIKSNDALQNPYGTVFETLRDRLRLPRDRVATFASWSVFNEIVEHTPGSTFVNAGAEDLHRDSEDVRALNRLQHEAFTPWAGTRFDAFTFRLAMAHLAAARPRVLYLALDETDDWAHDGRYGLVLDALARSDAYLKELWTWLQSQPDYRGRTHLLITVDHGRGHTPKDWRDHGAKVAGSDDVWIAFASPRMTRRGEWRGGTLFTNQIAATLASWMGVDWNRERPQSGNPIQQ